MKLQNKIIAGVLLTITAILDCFGQSYAVTVAPAIPKSMQFAGQTIDLDRVDRYERMDREIISFTFGQTNMLLTIKRANRYMPVIADILRANDLPEDLAYLAAIESHYDNTAVSGAKAAGMWQFMPSTAKEYGLDVNDYVDERLDYEKSTVAACKYFKRAYAKYKSWLSVAAAYNAGMSRISKSLENQEVGDAVDLYLNKETSRYIFRLLAMKLIVEQPSRYGYSIKANQLYQPLECETIEVSDSVESWVAWSKEHNVTYSILREYNPWIKDMTLPNASHKIYKVKIPKESFFYRSKQSLKTYKESWTK